MELMLLGVLDSVWTRWSLSGVVMFLGTFILNKEFGYQEQDKEMEQRNDNKEWEEGCEEKRLNGK